jgi:hypothetical protein
LDTVRVIEAQDRNPKRWKISHVSVLHAALFEKGRGLEKFSAVSNAKAQVV